METLAFRPPQFSEDLAWVPCWVQNQVEPFDECTNECPGSHSKLDSKVSALFRGNDVFAEEIKLDNNCGRLLLSGGDDSPSSFAPSSTDVLRFHLHLSSSGFSQCTASQLRASGASPSLSEPGKVSATGRFETNVTAKEKTSSKTSLGDGGLNFLPQSSIPEQCPRHEPKCKISTRDDGDVEINDAVELSISASEALVIHGIVTNKPDSIALVATDALEVSLQMKKARVEWVEEDAFDLLTEVDENDSSLSDLDDSAMTDAFEDVGIIWGSRDIVVSSPSISRVKETPASENHYGCLSHPGSVNLPEEFNYSPTESHNFEMQSKLHVDPALCSSPINVEREIDPLILKDPSGMDMVQLVGSTTEDLTSSRPQVKENIISASDSNLNNTRAVTTTYPILERFRSRWLGGWSVKEEINDSERVKPNNPKTILKAFARETSFLSESADIAPDENSFIQIRENQPHGESQLSIAVDMLVDKASGDILFTQDGVRSSNSFLLEDPLCSVVPCSISIEDANCAEAQKHNHTHTDLEGDLRPVVECEISNLDVEIQCGNEQVMPIVNEGSEGTVRKHMASLKTYSTLFPDTVPACDERNLRYNRSFQSQYGCGHCTVNPNTDSAHLPLITSATKCVPLNQSEELRIDDGDMVCHSPNKSNRPHILNPMIRRRFQAHKPSSVNFYGGEHHKEDGGIDDAVRLQQSEKPQNIQSAYKNSHQTKFRGRKRVRFTDLEGPGQIKSNKNTLELNSGGKLCQRSMLKGMQFLLTGLSSRKGKDIEEKIQQRGGIVLPDIPSLNVRGNRISRPYWYQLPIILSTRKQRTAKFLFGCAVNTFVLRVDWLTDSIRAGSTLPPEKYLILPWQVALGTCVMKQIHDANVNNIFEKIGIMLHGKHSFCTKLEKIVKHGGGQVCKSLQRLVECLDKKKISVGAIVTEDDNASSRHLRQCASEWKIPMMSSSWIIRSLYSGKLLPFTE